MKRFGILFLLLLTLNSYAQEAYRIYFKDKGAQQEELLTQPFKYLSPKAIENRSLRGVEIEFTDLPVFLEYISALTQMGIEVEMKSKWFNYAGAILTDAQLKKVEQLPFVVKTEQVIPLKYSFAQVEATQDLPFDYGNAENQTEMVRGNALHEAGMLGEGMTIAVLDGGFFGTDTSPAFDSLWMQNRVKGTYDFVQNDTDIYDVGSHGTKVLSVMTGFVDSQMVGSAPMANYWLLKSEDETSERIAEMDNWLEAAEFADSVGADMITSSLGYNEFDGGVGNHVYADMDGNTTVVTKAADMAAKKGILVIVSAGNEGNGPWHHITAPADGDSVLSVGAVNQLENLAGFSGRGPTSDNRIKPDVVAQGQATAYATSAGNVAFGQGTSFACPIISGFAACLWQSSPQRSNMDIYKEIIENSSQYFTPDNEKGFGIPNFERALFNISIDEIKQETSGFTIYPNPVKSIINLSGNGDQVQSITAIKIYDSAGKLIGEGFEPMSSSGKISIKAPELPGVYFLSISIGTKAYVEKIVK